VSAADAAAELREGTSPSNRAGRSEEHSTEDRYPTTNESNGPASNGPAGAEIDHLSREKRLLGAGFRLFEAVRQCSVLDGSRASSAAKLKPQLR
jgi:hypothetical protein